MIRCFFTPFCMYFRAYKKARRNTKYRIGAQKMQYFVLLPHNSIHNIKYVKIKYAFFQIVYLHSEICLKTSVNRNYSACNKARERVVGKVKHCSYKILGNAETIHGRVSDNLF